MCTAGWHAPTWSTTQTGDHEGARFDLFKKQDGIMNNRGDIYVQGQRKPIGCIFDPKDLPAILAYIRSRRYSTLYR